MHFLRSFPSQSRLSKFHASSFHQYKKLISCTLRLCPQNWKDWSAGKKGVAHTFFTHHNKGLAGELVNVLNEAGQVVPAALMKFGTHVKKKESKLYGAHFREISADAPKAKKITFDNSDDE